MRSKLLLNIITVILFLSLCCVGFILAKHKPLWNDEIYSQISSVEELSYMEIFGAQVGEGNNAPLFYVTQKVICNILQYHSPSIWRGGTSSWTGGELRDRIILRIGPVLSVSLAIAALFYFFSRSCSLWAGVFSFFLSMCSVMLWGYWAEARPYALWILLTMIQSLAFLLVLQKKQLTEKMWFYLSGIHLLLVLTSILSLPQVIIASILIWLFVEKGWKKYLFLLGVPSLVCIIYFFTAPKYNFWLEFSLEQYIRFGISRDRLYVILLFIIYLGLYAVERKVKGFRLYNNNSILEGMPYLFFTLGMIASVCCLFFVLRFKETGDHLGFPVSARYFVHMTPIGIVATTLFTIKLLQAFRDKIWMQGIIIFVIGQLVIHRLFKVIPGIKGFYPELFS